MKYRKTKGALATGHPITTEAGIRILELGGNIFDACVASGFTAPISEPLLTSLAGGGIMVGQDQKEEFSYDFFVNFPGLNGLRLKEFDPLDVKFSGQTQRFHIGQATIAVPGTLKGLLDIHKNHGRLPLEEVLRPAIDFARNGVEITPIQSYTMDLLAPLLDFTKEMRSLFYQNGKRLTHGDIFYNKDYPLFLEELSNKGPCFYENEIIPSLLKENNESHLNIKDFDSYEVKKLRPLKTNYHGRKILLPPSPCLGGLAVRDLLKTLEIHHLEKVGHHNAIFSTKLADSFKQFEDNFMKPFTKGTTHISGHDEFGNACSLSLTNGEGSGHFIPYTGIILNNMLGEDDLCKEDMSDWIPGERMGSMMCPLIVLGDEKLVLGAGGSKRIRSSLTQIISLIIDHKLSLSEAIQYPRMNYDGKTLQIEPGLNDTQIEKLNDLFEINLWPIKEFYFGGVNGVLGITRAQGDPRRGGYGRVI